jgi:hypothetical protein
MTLLRVIGWIWLSFKTTLSPPRGESRILCGSLLTRTAVGCPNNTSHGERGVQAKGGFFKKTTSWLDYPKGRPNPFANYIA